jgi:hypothetical protein
MSGWSLVIPLGQKGVCKHEIIWPVTRDEGLIFFDTTAGELCITRSEWATWQQTLRWPTGLSWGDGDQTRQLAWFDELPERILQCFKTLRSVSDKSRVEVTKVKEGSTSASRKVTVNVTIAAPGQASRKLVRVKTVPFSLLDQDSTGLVTLPFWFVRNNGLVGETEAVSTHPWTGLNLLKIDLDQKIAAAKSAYQEVLATKQQAQEEQLAKKKEQDARAAEHAAVRAKVGETIIECGEPILAFAKAKFTLAELRGLGANLEGWPDWVLSDGVTISVLHDLPPLIKAIKDLPEYQAWLKKNEHKRGQLLKRTPPKEKAPRQPDKVLENCSVTWVEWVGPTKNRQREDYESEGCTVRFFGQKCEIELPDGDVITKMQGPNLKITPPA